LSGIISIANAESVKRKHIEYGQWRRLRQGTEYGGYQIKIEGDIIIHEPRGVEYMVKTMLGSNDLLVMPRGRGKRKKSGQYSTAIYLGKPKKLNKIWSMLQFERKILLEIQFSNVIRELKKQGKLTYRVVKMSPSIRYLMYGK